MYILHFTTCLISPCSFPAIRVHHKLFYFLAGASRNREGKVEHMKTFRRLLILEERCIRALWLRATEYVLLQCFPCCPCPMNFGLINSVHVWRASQQRGIWHSTGSLQLLSISAARSLLAGRQVHCQQHWTASVRLPCYSFHVAKTSQKRIDIN